MSDRITATINSRVIIVDAVNLVLNIDRERHAVKALVADATPETARVVAFAHSLEDHLHDRVLADGALLGRLLEPGPQVVLLAVHLAVDVVEGLAAQGAPARAADEAVGVVEVAHGLARLARACHPLAARVADAEVLALFFLALHFFLELSISSSSCLVNASIFFSASLGPSFHHKTKRRRQN